MEIEDATVDVHGHVVATFTVSEDELPLDAGAVLGLSPRFTLATLDAHPVDGLRAWRSQLLTGATISALPPSGPGTPDPLVLTTVQQPGTEAPAALTELGDGRLRYTFAAALEAFDPDDTLRVGLFLASATKPSLRTATTFDVRPSGGPMEERETVLDESCAGCHGAAVVHHGARAGVKLCETCHTWQNADPDTIDPAALVTASTTARNNPNPLELGRLVHRIHRGKYLPTLYQASSSQNPAPGLPPDFAVAPSAPFTPENNTVSIVGRKYELLGWRSTPHVYGRVIQRTDNGQPAKNVVQGVSFPRDLRDCAACHDRAPQAYLVGTAVSRRTCAGCHPDVWFEAELDGTTLTVLDGTHLAHPGGAQGDDTRCGECHVAAANGSTVWAPIAEAHLPLRLAPRAGRPTIEIVRVSGMTPGSRPVVTFRLADRIGPIVPSPRAPEPAWEPDSATSSFLPRKFTSLAIRIAGPVAPDYPQSLQVISSWSLANPSNPDPLALVAGDADEYVYTFSSILPPTATGTWAVGMEGRRQLKYPAYDAAGNRFVWPYTGETVRESPDNPVVYVNVADGTYAANAARTGPGATPRRKVVSEEKCNLCHGRLDEHGKNRHQVEYCLFCHSPTTTDYPNRVRTAAGLVDLDASFDGIEERTVHFKVFNHRTHTGGHAGSASLEGIAPYLVGGTFFDDGRYPNDLANCTACHAGKSYLLENVPADSPPTVANETRTALHAPRSAVHVAGEPAVPPQSAACLGCHATSATVAHAALYTSGGVERCLQCHRSGALGVDVAHGLATLSSTTSAHLSSLVDQIFVPRCASTACHGQGANPPRLDAEGAYAGLLGSGGAGAASSSPLPMVMPGDPERSYLVHKLRGDAASVGGANASQMPPDGALSAADQAAVEAWISNGAPND